MKNISKIISVVFLSFSILLLCYTFYRSQIFHAETEYVSLYGVTKFDFYLKYYIFASLCILFSFASFFIPKKLKINITIVFVSILFSLYLIEGYLIIRISNLNKDNVETYKMNTGKDYDKRTRFQIYQALKKEDPNVVVKFPLIFLNDKNLNYLPLSGIPNRKTIHCNENGYYAIYQSDRYGFNNPDEEWDKEKIDYLLIGDSFVHGDCVNEPDTISGNLRKLIGNENGILNLGQAGSGPLSEYAILREYLPLKKTKRVLWLYYEGNDLADLNKELNNQILVNYLKDKNFSQNLISRKQEIQKLLLKRLDQETQMSIQKSETLMQKILYELMLFVKLYKLRGMYLTTPTPPKEFSNVLKLSNKLAKENNSKLYFIYLPEMSRLLLINNRDDWQHYKEIVETVANLNIPIIDLNKELFEKHEDPLSLFPFRKSGHFTEKGYQLIAKTIFNKIYELEK